jgi:hypothetical protein
MTKTVTCFLSIPLTESYTSASIAAFTNQPGKYTGFISAGCKDCKGEKFWKIKEERLPSIPYRALFHRWRISGCSIPFPNKIKKQGDQDELWPPVLTLQRAMRRLLSDMHDDEERWCGHE